MGASRLFRRRPRAGQARVLDPAAAAERHRRAAHGSRVQPDDHGRAHPLPPDARLQHAVAARNRSRRNSDPDRGRAAAGSRGRFARSAGPREIRGAGLGVEGAVGLGDHGADAPPRCVLRLAPRVLHDGPEALARRDRDVRPASRGGVDLPRQAARQLGPGAAHRGLRPRGGKRGGGRPAVAHPLSVRGRPDRRLARPDGRDHAARDDARRRGGRGESRRRALSASDRPARTSPARRARDPGHRRRVRGPGVRHGLPQDHARPRLQRLPGRPAARPAADRRPDARGEDQRKRAAELPRPRPLRGPQAHRGRPAVARIARIGQAAPHDRPEVRPDGRGGRADADRPVVRRDVEARALRDAVPGQVDRRGRAGGGRAGRGEVRTGQLGEHLQPVARQHPGLVHLAPALVGPPDPRLVRRRRPDLRRPRRSRGGRTGAAPAGTPAR